jgi:hypothetical protein
MIALLGRAGMDRDVIESQWQANERRLNEIAGR